jgi:DNA-binding Lrp family transcriptional regulator
MLTDLEKNVIASIQADIPAVKRPFLKMAKKLGISEEAFLQVLNSLCDRGIIRRFGATLRHQQSGFNANAMVAWQVEEGKADAVGEIMASFKEVTHCYHRKPKSKWPYNIYTMIHAIDEKTCLEIASKMAEKAGIETYKLLFSKKELKKTSMKYFFVDDEN